MSTQVYSGGALVEEWDDETRTYTDHRTDPPTTRPYTPEEDAAADVRMEADARLDDLEARVAALEAAVFPPDPDPEPGTTPDAPTFEDHGGVWPNGQLLTDGGKVWRNVSGVPLTTPPSGFPGDPSAWAHLFVEVTAPAGTDPEPEAPEGYVGPWDKDTSYAVGDVVDKDGHYYRCLIAHGAEQQGMWAPGPSTPTIWADIGVR